MRQRSAGLRSILTTAMLVIGLLAVAVSILLVVLTSRLHSASRSLADTVESLNLANEAEVDLLFHNRTTDTLARRQLEGELKRTLVGLRRFVSSAAEERALHDMSYRVDQYFAATHDEAHPAEAADERFDAAYQALAALVDVNLRHARGAREDVARWDSRASGVGVSTALSLLLVSACFVWWLRARAFRPVFSLLDAMERFGRGDRDVRASDTGPSELRDLAERFNEMAAALATQRQAQVSFIGGIAHDLRNPLTALKIATASAGREGKFPPDVKLGRLVEQAERQIARMERMLNDLLDTTRIEAGKLDLRFEWRDARDLVREVASMFEATSPNHRLIVAVPGKEILLRCDPLRIEQVLSNLVSNAIKFSPNGGGVMIGLESDGAEAVLSVADSGVGISEEDQRRLFEPFRRVGSSKDVIPGVGLGLFVVREIVLAHGGRVEVVSAPGRGTEFRVRLQTDRSAEPGAAGRGVEPEAPLSL
jgi:two-component system, OmpR family, sensor histidine kinase MtrB